MPFLPSDEDEKWTQSKCTSPEHDPPRMIVLPPGTHKYQCPQCGQIQTIVIPEIRC